jgi:hypothetical protein
MGRPAKYEVRTSPAIPEKLVFRVVQQRPTMQTSDDELAVDVHDKPVVSSLENQQAAGFKVATSYRESIHQDRSVKSVSDNFEYQGKTYTSSGPALRSALLSPDGSWLAMLSETVEDQNIWPRINLD